MQNNDDEFINNMEAIISDRVQKEFEERFGLKCPNCDLSNHTDSRYCNECGMTPNKMLKNIYTVS
jgi:hypothetical protein